MADFKLDSLTGDLDFGLNNSVGLQIHTNLGEESVQRINQAITLNLAEWFADTLAGLPYIINTEENVANNLRYFFGDKNKTTPRFVFVTMNKYIKDLPFVTGLTSEFNYNASTRVLTYSPDITITDGTSITFPPVDLNI